MEHRVPVGPQATEPAPDWSGRAILHVDLDCFYAAVEILDEPALAGRPVIVGGSGPRAVVASASYEARAFGVRSATPMGLARRLCPMGAYRVPRFERYRDVSRRFGELLRSFTALVEPVALDEAYLDVTGGWRSLGQPPEIAAEIRRQVGSDLGLDCAVGVARSKLVAKLASRAAKPRPAAPAAPAPQPGPGVLVVTAQDEPAFLLGMPVSALPGVGPATAARLAGIGVTEVGDVAAVPPATLRRALGRFGEQLSALATGRDPRPVVAERETKSVSHEQTFPRDLEDRSKMSAALTGMAHEVAVRLRAQALAGRTVAVKVRLSDFRTLARSRTLASATDDPAELAATARSLLERVELDKGVRLLGVGVSQLETVGGHQLTLDEAGGAPDARAAAETAAGRVRARFGASAVGLASDLSGLPALSPGGTTRTGQ